MAMLHIKRITDAATRQQIGQKSIFLEHGHVAYLIKMESRMQQHGCNYFAPSPPHNASKFSPYTHPKPVGSIKR